MGRRHRDVEHQPLQPRHDGLPHAQHRPHRERRGHLHRLLFPAELHRRPRVLHHRPEPDPHGSDQGRHARRHRRPAEGRPDHRRTSQAAGLRHRPVRQEPSGRPRRIPADRAWVRRILRQSLSPERRGRARTARLSQGPGVQEAVRPPRRAPLPVRRQGRSDDRGHRPAHQEAHGNHRRGDHRSRHGVDGDAGQGGEAVLPLVQFDGHALPDPRRRKESRQERAGPLQRPDGRPRRADRPDARQAR